MDLAQMLDALFTQDCQQGAATPLLPDFGLPSSQHCAPPSVIVEVHQDARFFHAWCPEHHPDWVCSPAGVLAHHPAVIRLARPHHSVLAPKSNGNTRAQCPPRPANGVQGVLTRGRDISLWVGQVANQT